jgi:hypothetical protein
MSLSKPVSTHLQLAGIGGNSFSMSTSFRAVWDGLTKFGWESLLRNLRFVIHDRKLHLHFCTGQTTAQTRH